MRKYLFPILTLIFLSGCDSSTIQKTEYKPYVNKTPERATILAIGQSNMANSGQGLYYVSSNDVLRIDNNYNLVLAQTPSINNLATGTGSNFLPLLGDMLIEKDKYSSVRYANVAVSGSCVIEWTPAIRDRNFPKIEAIANQGFEFTHIIYHQGECDTKDWFDTSKEDYKKYFLQMKKGLRDLGINAPIYLARTSYVYGITDPKIIEAQNELINENPDIFEGPYTDVLGPEYRYDNVHFNRAGLIEHARMWSEYIK